MPLSLHSSLISIARKASGLLFLVCNTLVFIIIITIAGCKSDSTIHKSDISIIPYHKYAGRTMGTTYNITYDSLFVNIPQRKIDSILVAINQSVSTYIDTSTISKINKKTAEDAKEIEILVNGNYVNQSKSRLPYDKYFVENYQRSLRIFLDTEGAFDPTVMPLVNYWGFGYTTKRPITQVDSLAIIDMLTSIGMEKTNLESDLQEMVITLPVNGELDFSAIAKGYAVDELFTYMVDRGVDDLLVEIGGEVRAKGRNSRGKAWTVGLNTPKENAKLNEFSGFVRLDNTALASSGNYRNFHNIDGRKYGHEINPSTGFPEINDLLGVSVLAPDCTEADAIATALMIMGYNKGQAFIDKSDHLEACFFISDNQGQIIPKMTKGMIPIASSNF